MDKQALSVIYTNLDSALQRQVSALPDKFNKQRFLQKLHDSATGRQDRLLKM